MKYLIYLRVSTNKQDDEMQRFHCLNYIKTVNKDQNPIIFYADPDVSSKIKMEKRQGLQEMLGAVQEGDVIVTFKLDRLSRDIIEMVTIYRIIKAKKAQVYSLSEPGIEEWMLGIFASLAQKEREDIGARTKAKLAEIKSKGIRLGRIPYGYKANSNGELTIDETESLILEKMYNYRKKGLTFREIADRLNAAGYRNRPTKKRNEVPWTYGATSRVYINYEKINS